MLSAAPTPTRKRLHRSAAATVKSCTYAQSDSDDGSPTLGTTSDSSRGGGARTVESNLQLWIKHLHASERRDQERTVFAFRYGAKPRKLTLFAQFNEKKRHLEQSSLSSPKPRTVKSEFLRTLTTGLRELRQLESSRKLNAHILAVPDMSSGNDDDEYLCPKRPSKRRKTFS